MKTEPMDFNDTGSKYLEEPKTTHMAPQTKLTSLRIPIPDLERMRQQAAEEHRTLTSILLAGFDLYMERQRQIQRMVAKQEPRGARS